LILNHMRAACISVIFSLLFSTQITADTTDILVYKGELRFVLPVDERARESLLIQHRSKTRNVLRIAIQGLTVTNMDTYEHVRLPDRSAALMNNVDNDGYWITDFVYDDLKFTNASHRVEGRAILYLSGSQRTRNFNVYLRPETYWEPSRSSIDWGIDN
jgi:hypothetical protein